MPSRPTPVGGDEPGRGQAFKVVARSFSGKVPPYGLDQPLVLIGGDHLGPAALASRLALDWTPDLLDVVAETCSRQAAADEPWLTLPPLNLMGGPGAGRTHLARQIARHVGLPCVSMDVSGPLGADRLRRERRSPDVSLPPLPILAMAASGCANPIVLVTGVDHATDQTLDLLAPMIDPGSSARWVDEALGMTVDLSHVSWLVATASDPLNWSFGEMLRPVQVARPSLLGAAGFGVLAVSILREVLADLDLTRDDLGPGAEAMLRTICDRRAYTHSVSELHRQITEKVLSSLRS